MIAEGKPTLPRRAAVRLTVLLGLRDQIHHKSLMIDLLQRARHAKLAGATAFEAAEGYGHSGKVHRAHLLSEDTPVALVIVDDPTSIDAFVAANQEVLRGLVVIRSDVEIVEV